MTAVRGVDLAQDLDEFHDVYLRSYTRSFDAPWLAAEKRVNLTDDDYGTKIALIARDDVGVAIGGGSAVMPLQDNIELAYLDVFVLPDRRREGIGSRVLEGLIGVARAHRRSRVFVESAWAVDADGDAGRWFAEARGFGLDILDAVRELALPAALPPLVVAPDYTLETWRGPCPEDVIDEYADLRRILTSEAPSGDAGLEDEYWDAARVRKDEADLVQAGREMQVVVARSSGGELAGHTQLAFPADGTEVYQWDTLVRASYRGHGLGLALKIRAMQASADLLEGRRRTAWAGEYVRAV